MTRPWLVSGSTVSKWRAKTPAQTVEWPHQHTPTRADQANLDYGAKLVHMAPSEFLQLADNEVRHRAARNPSISKRWSPMHYAGFNFARSRYFKRDVYHRAVQSLQAGHPVDAPVLFVNEVGKLYGHDGRHRAVAAHDLGVTKMPVILRGSGIHTKLHPERTEVFADRLTRGPHRRRHSVTEALDDALAGASVPYLAALLCESTIPGHMALDPAEPGTRAIPSGHVRLYHYTDSDETLDKIAQHGIRLQHAKGHTYAEPNGVWASAERPRPGKSFVEFSLHPSDKRWIVGNPTHWGTDARGWTDEHAREWEKKQSNVALAGDVEPHEITSIHKSWHHHARYALNNPEVERGWHAGEFEWMKGDPEYGKVHDFLSTAWPRKLEEGKQEYAHHVTSTDLLPSIAKHGLLPRPHEWADEPAIFVEPGEEDVAPYHHPPSTSMLRFPVPSDYRWATNDNGEYLHYSPVSPHQLQIKHEGSWQPLRSVVKRGAIGEADENPEWKTGGLEHASPDAEYVLDGDEMDRPWRHEKVPVEGLLRGAPGSAEPEYFPSGMQKPRCCVNDSVMHRRRMQSIHRWVKRKHGGDVQKALQQKPVLVEYHNGNRSLLDGYHRTLYAHEKGHTHVPAVVVDLSSSAPRV